MRTQCKYCKFRKGCEHIKRGETKDCMFVREANPYDNGEE